MPKKKRGRVPGKAYISDVARRRKKKQSRLVLRRRILMVEHGLTQTALAKKWGVTQSFVSQLISGNIRSKPHERKFARLFKLKREDLFEPTAREAARA
jgi:transcriptional regulator with XRE-family HTH domain